jgi:hypothetical protein
VVVVSIMEKIRKERWVNHRGTSGKGMKGISFTGRGIMMRNRGISMGAICPRATRSVEKVMIRRLKRK